MSKDEIIKELQAMVEQDNFTGIDREAAHIRADELLVSRLRDLGDNDVADAFENTKAKCRFWYS